VSDHPDFGFGTDPPPRGDLGTPAAPPPPPRPDLWSSGPVVPESRDVRPEVPISWGPRDALAVYLMAGGATLYLGILLRTVHSLRGPAGEAIGGFLQESLLILVVVWWTRTYGDGNLHSLGYPPRRPWGDVWSGLGIGLLAVVADVVVAIAVNSLVRAITGHTPHRPPSVTNDLHGAWTLPVAFVAVVMAPLGEETLFRGFILQGLEQGLSRWRAILISAAFFAFVHVYPLAMPSVFVIGILFALLYLRRRSLLATMTAHATVNLVVTLVAITNR
jgi:membrane protease YdiL (CAAX protease family)